jgi:hypothetical protein
MAPAAALRRGRPTAHTVTADAVAERRAFAELIRQCQAGMHAINRRRLICSPAKVTPFTRERSPGHSLGNGAFESSILEVRPIWQKGLTVSRLKQLHKVSGGVDQQRLRATWAGYHVVSNRRAFCAKPGKFAFEIGDDEVYPVPSTRHWSLAVRHRPPS